MSVSGRLYPIGIALLLLVIATCTDFDNPVAVEGLSVESLLPTAVSADGGQQAADKIVESFGQRLAVGLSFSGDLTPNGTTTLTLEGVANGTLTGAQVRVMLPTKAAMDHAGTGKVPYYPMGRQIPTVANWSLSGMDAGDTWERSLSISLPGAGAYQVAVMVMPGTHGNGPCRSRCPARAPTKWPSWIDYLDQVDESLRSLEVTVPSDGVVTVDCPDSYEYIVASVVVTNTNEIINQYTIGGSEVYNDDCGTTRTILTNAYTFIVWRDLHDLAEIVEDYFDVDRSPIKWAMVFADSNETFYYRNSDKVTFDYATYDSKWVIAHEFAHGLHHKGLGGIVGSSCANHDIAQPSSYSCAFFEGFADFAGNVGRGDPQYWERAGYTASGYDDAEIEGNVARLFWDLIDTNEDGNDETDYPADFLADVFKTCRAHGTKRNDVTDYVWCLENRVNADVHEDHFPNGPSAPGFVSRNADEPDDYDEDEIRATWIQNVG